MSLLYLLFSEPKKIVFDELINFIFSVVPEILNLDEIIFQIRFFTRFHFYQFIETF